MCVYFFLILTAAMPVNCRYGVVASCIVSFGWLSVLFLKLNSLVFILLAFFLTCHMLQGLFGVYIFLSDLSDVTVTV